MRRIVLLGWNSFLVLLLVFTATRAPGQALSDPIHAANDPARPPDYKIAFWYLRSDPLTSLKHQVYDVRLGQYTRAVDDWLRTMHAKHADYAAYVTELRLNRASGESEKRQLATAILGEYVLKGGPDGGLGVRDMSGIHGGRFNQLVSPGHVPARRELRSLSETSRYSRGYGFANSPGANRTPSFGASPFEPSSGIPSPFPYPSVRRPP